MFVAIISFCTLDAWRSLPDVIPLPFESAAWKRADPIERHRTVRSQMVDDLLKKRLLYGMTRAEIKELLGLSEPNLDQSGVDASRWHMAYFLGMERAGAFSLDDEFLVIRFDKDGRAIEVRTIVN